MSRRPSGNPTRLVGVLAGALLLGAGWQLVGSAPGAQCAPPRPINLVLISIDTLRADRLSVYGYGRPTSPFLERLAAEGVLFERFYYNGGGTLPSHMTMLTSLHPVTHGIEPSSDRVLPPERTTLAEVLAAHGYRTAAFVDPGWMNSKYGFYQGFEIYDEEGYHLEGTLPRALRWIEERGTDPFFLFLHTYDVHSSGRGEARPYDCPGESELHFVEREPESFDGCRDGECGTRFLRTVNESRRGGAPLDDLLAEAERAWISDLYDGCVRYVDTRLEELYHYLERSALLERTVLVVVSDHGEEFGEHGMMLHEQGGYEELSWIPWILRPPRGGARGVRVEGLAAMADVMPTLLDLLDLPPPEEAQGRSLVPAIAKGYTGRPAVHMYDVLADARFKYFSDLGLLFDLARDPAERINRIEAEPAVAAAMETTVRDWIARDKALARELDARSSDAAPARLSDEEVARLRALGYLR